MNNFERSIQDPTDEQRTSRDWEAEQRAERRFQRQSAADPWVDNWVEMPEFTGHKPPVRAENMQMDLDFGMPTVAELDLLARLRASLKQVRKEVA